MKIPDLSDPNPDITAKRKIDLTEFFFRGGKDRAEDDVYRKNKNVIMKETGFERELALVRNAKDKYKAESLEERRKRMKEIYEQLCNEVLEYINRIIWLKNPFKDKTAYFDKDDNLGTLSGKTLSSAFELALDYAKSLAAFHQVVMEINFPSTVYSRAIEVEKRSYLQDVQKNNEIAEITNKKPSKKKK